MAEWMHRSHLEEGSRPVEEGEVPGCRARRWVVERTKAWMNRVGRLLIRWEKKGKNYLALTRLPARG